ncbi:MAG: cupin domain-containing protein [Candidatus Staskawiczbacteria bacterium]|jgi:mannose-6-phosphate isomerase-like protein (cupin superfamily)
MPAMSVAGTQQHVDKTQKATMKIPNVLDFLTKAERDRAIFVRPTLGKELEAVDGIGHNFFPQCLFLSAKLMTLQKGTVIPFHAHANKEKFYLLLDGNNLQVTMATNEKGRHEIRTVELMRGDVLFIPTVCPHCVRYCPQHYPDPCKVLVIASSQNSDDIYWEDGVEALISNGSSQ